MLSSISLRRKTAFSTKNALPVKTIASSCDVGGERKIYDQHRFLIIISMAARSSSSSSDDILSQESDSNNTNFYGSDDDDLFVPLEECEPHPYQFEPRRVGETSRTTNKKTLQNQMTVTKIVSETRTGI